MPENILNLLKSFKDQEYIGEEQFIDALKKKIGKGETTTYKSLILKHATKSMNYLNNDPHNDPEIIEMITDKLRRDGFMPKF